MQVGDMLQVDGDVFDKTERYVIVKLVGIFSHHLLVENQYGIRMSIHHSDLSKVTVLPKKENYTIQEYYSDIEKALAGKE